MGIDTYDEYGVPGAANLGRFQYTGQAWLPELGAYYYKARFYSPPLGRFLQTDPIGYADSPNLYAYVGNDPVNNVDPLGLAGIVSEGYLTQPIDPNYSDIVITASSDIIVTGDRCRVFDCGTREVHGTEAMFRDPAPRGGGEGGIGPVRGAPAVPAQQKPTKSPPKRPPPYDRHVNYCGGEGGAALPNAVGGVSINDLCYRHDLCYGGSGTPIGQCDADFGLAVIWRLGAGNLFMLPPIGPLMGVIPGILGYGIVTFGGDKYYVPK